MDKKYTFADLITIIKELRSEHGCPWDRVQTHSSLTSCMLEESYEVIEGIRILEETGSWNNLQEELGDVLLQVVMHGTIAAEEGFFTIDDVIQGITEKMIRRHPHVFADTQVNQKDQVRLNWEEIKKQEKSQMPEKNPLKEIPLSFPALIRAEKVQKKLDNLYGGCPSGEESLKRAEHCLQQLRKESSAKERSTIFGELLWEIVNIARSEQVHSEEALLDFLETIIKNKTL